MDGDKTLTAVFKEIEEEPEDDPLAKAAAAVEAVEALELPQHYDEVEGVEALIKEAAEAIALVEDPFARLDLEERLAKAVTPIEAELEKRVTAVNNAGTDLDLLEALESFWTVDATYIDVYDDLIKEHGSFDSVHDIQKEVVEKAPLVDEEATVVKAVVESAGKESLIGFKATLTKYAVYFERINFANDTLEQYRTNIVKAIEELESIEAIQEIIDDINFDNANSAVTTALAGVKRSDWNDAVALMVYVAEGEDKEGLQEQLDAHDLIIKVSEATTNVSLKAALVDLEIDYLYDELMNDYLAAIKEADTKNSVEAIQGIVNGVNEANVEAILEDIGAIEEDTSLSLVESLLIKLDKATPISDNLDFDLNDKDLAFDRARLSYYRSELVSLTVTGIAEGIKDVETAIKNGNTNADAEFSHFEVKKAEAKINESLSFEVKALNVAGKAYDDFQGKEVSVTVTIGETEKPLLATFADDVLSVNTGITFTEIGEHVATLTFELEDKEYILETDVLIDADPVVEYSTVKTDKKEYVAGENIEITVTLLYDEDKVLATENGTYPAAVTVGEEVYNEEFAFTAGVASVTVEARKAAEGQKVSLAFGKATLTDDEFTVSTTDEDKITIKAGQPATLDAVLRDAAITLTVKDKQGNTADYKGSKKVIVSVEEVVKVASMDVSTPDKNGVAYVTFEDGVGNITLTSSPLFDGLVAGNYEVTVELVELGFTDVVEYTVSSSESGE